MQKSYSDYTPKIVGGSILGISLLIALYTLVVSPMAQISSRSSASTGSATATTTTPTTAESSSTSSNTTTTTSTTTRNAISDGTFSETVSYRVPHETNSITVSLTVKDGAVTAVKTNHDYADQESAYYIDSFDSLIESEVIGKKISSVSLSRVGGASLTTQAFDEALSNIANLAKA